jgi:exosome complex RNA-binding protein Rrp4
MFRFLLVALVVVLVGLAIFRGWVRFSWQDDSDQSQTTMTIDKEKIKEDVRDLRKQVLPKTGSTVTGKVQTVGQDQITVVTNADKTVTLDIVPETKIRVGDRAGSLADVHPGDMVTMAQVHRENREVATSLTVKDGKD